MGETHSHLIVEVAGWQGTTTQSALGSLDRANTTDVPEEIEPIPGNYKP